MSLAALDRRLLTASVSGASQVAESGKEPASVPALRPRLLDQLPWLGEMVRASRPRYLPVVLSRAEVRAVLDASARGRI